MQNMLVPLDGSPLAEAALPFACAVAARAGASLTLVQPARYGILSGEVDSEPIDAHDIDEGYLACIAANLRRRGVPVDTRARDSREWILEESDSCHAELIVMATHDRRGPDRWLHDGLAENVVHRSRVPVMLVRPTADVLVAQRFEAHEPILLVPLDRSELADTALPVAAELARSTGARIVVLGVVPKPGQLVATQTGDIVTRVGGEQKTLEARAVEHMKARVAWLGQVAGVETTVRYGEAAAEIGAAADEYAAAAVVMATHGRTGPVRSILSSVAGRVVHATTVPVVLIRPLALASESAWWRDTPHHTTFISM